MNVSIQDAGPCRKLMRVHAEPGEVRKDYEEILGLYAAQANVPGFRAGKAPSKVVERRFARQIAEQAKDRLVPTLYHDAIKKEGLNPVAVIGVSDVRFARDEGLAFDVTLDVAPEFKLPKYKKIVIRQQTVSVEEKDIDETVRRIREHHGRYEDVTGRGVADGDLVRIDYEGICEGEPLLGLVPDHAGLAGGKDFLILVGGAEFIPGFSAGLIGMAIGESKPISAAFPEDYPVAVLAGKQAVYRVEVKGVRERILPELDEKLLKELDVASEQELRQKVRQDLEKAAEDRERSRQRDEICRFLIEGTEFDLPQSIVEQETNLAVRNIVRRIMSQGGSRDQIVEQQESIVDNAARSTRDRVKLSYVLSRIADELDLSVADEEVEERLREMAATYRMPPERLRAELEKRNGMENLRSDIRTDKTLDVLLAEAKIKK